MDRGCTIRIERIIRRRMSGLIFRMMYRSQAMIGVHRQHTHPESDNEIF